MESYVTVKQGASFEYEEKKSVFIADASPVSTESDAIEFIESVKKKYPDARHHVYAYVLRENSIMRFSDDHEPQGTAGMPVLDVIRKNGCTDTVIVVTRYFGGTLLGTGGLVRAYTASALGALRAAEIITYDVYSFLKISCSYSDYQKLSAVLALSGFRSTEVNYSDSVEIFGSIRRGEFDALAESIVESSCARAKVELLEERFDY